ncbi:ferredoxin [Amycolatopsis sp. NPDC005232]|uniref:ferredoxin n=1 Tax=Amycolatopsis sp. NPDC005232 TaxID=3157027 RepID=UPI0033AE0AB1
MRVRVDRTKCRGHGVCCVNAPDIFTIGDDDHAYVENEVVAPGREEDALMGARNCPEQAIYVH